MEGPANDVPANEYYKENRDSIARVRKRRDSIVRAAADSVKRDTAEVDTTKEVPF